MLYRDVKREKSKVLMPSTSKSDWAFKFSRSSLEYLGSTSDLRHSLRKMNHNFAEVHF